MDQHDALALFSSTRHVVLDGAMATELEKRGVDTAQPLWSAVAMRDCPEAIVAVHRSYLDAGAQVLTTNSYQASVPTLLAAGLDEATAQAMVRDSARLALLAREQWRADGGSGTALVAGSIGPYGAHLADGSEYTGDYRLEAGQYEDFHRERIALLVAEGVDLLAVETQPRLDEVQAVLGLVAREFPDVAVTVSFSLGEDGRLPAGGGQDLSLAQAVQAVQQDPRVLAVGVNCVPRDLVAGAVVEMAAVADRPLLVAPNSGERYDPVTKTWSEGDPSRQLEVLVPQWLESGAWVVGGCCRTSPSTIMTVRELLADGGS